MSVSGGVAGCQKGRENEKRWQEIGEVGVPVRIAETDDDRVTADARNGGVDVELGQDGGKQERQKRQSGSSETQKPETGPR
jgi:hypothetical protein